MALRAAPARRIGRLLDPPTSSLSASRSAAAGSSFRAYTTAEDGPTTRTEGGRRSYASRSDSLPPLNWALGEGSSRSGRGSEPQLLRDRFGGRGEDGSAGVERMIEEMRRLIEASDCSEGGPADVSALVDRIRLAHRLQHGWSSSVHKLPALRKASWAVKKAILSGIQPLESDPFPIPTSSLAPSELGALETSYHLAASQLSPNAPRADLERQSQRAWRLALHYLGLCHHPYSADTTSAFATSLDFGAAFQNLARRISRLAGNDPSTVPLRDAADWLQRHQEAHLLLQHLRKAFPSRTIDPSSSHLTFLRSILSVSDDHLASQKVLRILRMLYDEGLRLDLEALVLLWRDAVGRPKPSADLVLFLARKLPPLLPPREAVPRKELGACLLRSYEVVIKSAGAFAEADARRNVALDGLNDLVRKLDDAGYPDQALLDHLRLAVQLQRPISPPETVAVLDRGVDALLASTHPDPYLVSSIVRAIGRLPDSDTRSSFESRLSTLPSHALNVARRSVGKAPQLSTANSPQQQIGQHIARAQALLARIEQSPLHCRHEAFEAGHALVSIKWSLDPSAGCYGGAAERHALRSRQRRGLSLLAGSYLAKDLAGVLNIFDAAASNDPQIAPSGLPARLLQSADGSWNGSSGLKRVLESVTAWYRRRREAGLGCLPVRETGLWRLGKKDAMLRVQRTYGTLLRTVLHPDDVPAEEMEVPGAVAARVQTLLALLTESGLREWHGSEVLKAMQVCLESSDRPAWLENSRVWQTIAGDIDAAWVRSQKAEMLPFGSLADLASQSAALQAAMEAEPELASTPDVAPLPIEIPAVVVPGGPLGEKFFDTARPPPIPPPSFAASFDKGAKEYTDQSLLLALCAVAAESLEGFWSTKVVRELKAAEEEARKEAEEEGIRKPIEALAVEQGRRK